MLHKFLTCSISNGLWPHVAGLNEQNNQSVNQSYTRLYQHISQNNILATEQYSFRNNSSTEKASLKLINEILLALNDKLTVGGIFCNLEKAFYSINHDILLSKCEFYGFRCKTNALLRSYVSDIREF